VLALLLHDLLVLHVIQILLVDLFDEHHLLRLPMVVDQIHPIPPLLLSLYSYELRRERKRGENDEMSDESTCAPPPGAKDGLILCSTAKWICISIAHRRWINQYRVKVQLRIKSITFAWNFFATHFTWNGFTTTISLMLLKLTQWEGYMTEHTFLGTHIAFRLYHTRKEMNSMTRMMVMMWYMR
jgi:hypothetical protein